MREPSPALRCVPGAIDHSFKDIADLGGVTYREAGKQRDNHRATRMGPNERHHLLCGEPSEPGGDIINITAVLGCSSARHATRWGGGASRYEMHHEYDQC